MVTRERTTRKGANAVRHEPIRHRTRGWAAAGGTGERRDVKWLAFVLVSSFVLFLSGDALAGYTHYWKWKRDPDPSKVEAAVLDMKRVVEAKKDILEVPDAEPPSSLLVFNGIGPDAHETFGFPLAPFAGTPDFNFVKTAYKPYDEVVTACLIVARDHFTKEELEISSDGDWNDWQKGRALYTQVFVRAANNPLSESTTMGDDEPAEPLVAPPPPQAPVSRWRTVGITVAVIAALVVVRLLMGGRS